ncbi:type I pantothenate kinase, partial [Enterococcus faecalis]|nr:type I pantothenate kinase [Enterococcus faecalis]
MDDKMNYYPISREEWHGFYHDGKAPLTEAELDNIKSVNDQISLKDVQEIYVPLTHLIHLYMKEFES